MDLARFPRRHYTDGPTPFEPLRALSRVLGGPRVWIKRDDQLGLTAGGNKTRKLEFLVADALAKGADTLITAGGVQSNHARLTLAAAVREHLACRLVLEEDLAPGGSPAPGGNPPAYDGNYLLFDLLGAERVETHPNGADLDGLMEEMAQGARAEGRTPYLIPVGGSSPRGALGYVAAAQEIIAQSSQLDAPLSAIVVPSGSAGMHVGLVVGLHAANTNVPVIGINVSRTATDQEPRIAGLADETTGFLDLPAVPHETIISLGEYFAPGYALPNDAMVEAVRLFARTEGILLDPVYTGKAAAGLIDLIRRGTWGPDENVLLVHSGGVPGLWPRAGFFAATSSLGRSDQS
ncbi:D-cysteine desulfhydrase [uncultured Propionibacterium sp.]|uniref:D-cysteine desulfhydrase n=1 Tax=uncultured Propionibacterium sp. TaxID=218066 RepID=UPI00292E4E6A|nr:D-cysteine desulfhydrase [uncultured Propionibacterium sp.]